MTADLIDSFDPAPDSLAGGGTLFNMHERELVDAAALFRLVGSDLERVTTAVETVAGIHDSELEQNLSTRQAILDGELAFAEEDLQRRTELLPRLQANYELRTQLRDSRASVSAEVVESEVNLLSRRQEAEEKRLERELLRVQQQETDERLGRVGPATEETSQNAVWDARIREIDDLKERRAAIVDAERTVFEREERLKAQSITRTVAGFLLWLGYASAVATGSVLALVMTDAKGFDLRPLAIGMRSMISSVLPGSPAWIRFFIILAFILILMWLTARVFVACDNLLRRQWQWEEKTRNDATAQMSPQALTPKTYAGAVALLPFAFAIAAIMAVLSLAPQGVGGDADGTFFTSIFPSVGYSFVGIAIAFLSTAVFAMYFIHVVQPRRDATNSVLRNSWEFAIPPLLLITSLAVAPFNQNVNASRWLPWAAFMLLSSLSLACGLVFHGIFKDARRARERLVRIDRRLQRASGIVVEEPDDSADSQAVREAPIATHRRWLERIARSVRLGRSQIGGTPQMMPATPSSDVTDDVGSAGALLAGALVPTYRAIDVSVAPELIRRIEERRSVVGRIDSELNDVNAAIAELEMALSFVAMSQLRKHIHRLRAVKKGLVPHQQERRYHASIAKELLLLKIGGTDLAAQAIAPLFATVRDAVARTKPTEDSL